VLGMEAERMFLADLDASKEVTMDRQREEDR
jgi:hypothetical protein